MSVLGEPRLVINFTSRFEEPPIGFLEEHGDASRIIPTSVLANVISQTNEIMLATWNYALWHSSDDRFNELRKLAAVEGFDRRNIELVIVDVTKGSIEASLAWAAALYASSELLRGVTVNALWDLAKFGLGALRRTIAEANNTAAESDPLINELLPQFVPLVREAYKDLPRGASVRTEIKYRSPEQEFSVILDRQAQEKVIKANEIEIEFVSRLTGTIVGVDYSENLIGVRWEQFPEQTMWSDIEGIDIKELEGYLPKSSKVAPRRVGFEVELGWRRGATKVFPPDAIRIIRIIPIEQMRDPRYLGPGHLQRNSSYHTVGELQEVEQKFLKWLDWMDKVWDNPNLAGIVGYLQRKKEILGARFDRKELEKLVRDFVQRGILLRTRSFSRRDPAYQPLRLNRSHPQVMKYLHP
jgi:hypothetical protein